MTTPPNPDQPNDSLKKFQAGDQPDGLGALEDIFPHRYHAVSCQSFRNLPGAFMPTGRTCDCWVRKAKAAVRAHIALTVTTAHLDEANRWNYLCGQRDSGQITHDYYVELRDKRIDELQADQPNKEGE